LCKDILNAAFTIHHADKLIGSRIESMAAARGGIFQQVPDLAAIIVPVNFDLTVQPRF
jgi:hypothetical protein